MISCARSTPNCSSTVSWATRTSVSTSAAVAWSTLTMKFACFDEICAPPDRRLRRLALRLDRVGTLPNPIRVIGMDAESHTHDHVGAELVLETRVAVPEVAGGGGERDRLAARVQRRAVDQHVRHLRSECAGVATHARAARTRHPDAELDAREAARRAVQSHARHHAAGTQLDGVIIGDPQPAVVVANHEPIDAVVADQRVAPGAERRHPDPGVGAAAEQLGEHRDVPRGDEPPSRATDAELAVASERLIADHAGEGVEPLTGGHPVPPGLRGAAAPACRTLRGRAPAAHRRVA